jgi:TetR/AcrR family transcriptional regulator, transcriptional repressor of aconitase
MPKVSDAHRESRRDQITDAALRSFAANGFQRTSMADIIAESGLSAGAIYGHFESKQQIAYAVAERVLGNRLGELAAQMRGSKLPDPDQVVAIITEGMRRDLTDPSLLLQLWGESVHDEEIRSLVSSVFAEVKANLTPYLAGWAQQKRGLSPEESIGWAETALPVMLAFAQGYIVQSALLPEFDRERYLAAIRAVL